MGLELRQSTVIVGIIFVHSSSLPFFPSKLIWLEGLSEAFSTGPGRKTMCSFKTRLDSDIAIAMIQLHTYFFIISLFLFHSKTVAIKISVQICKMSKSILIISTSPYFNVIQHQFHSNMLRWVLILQINRAIGQSIFATLQTAYFNSTPLFATSLWHRT